jgi:hypothetical protein
MKEKKVLTVVRTKEVNCGVVAPLKVIWKPNERVPPAATPLNH